MTFNVVRDNWITTKGANDIILAIRVEVFNVTSKIKVVECIFTLRTSLGRGSYECIFSM